MDNPEQALVLQRGYQIHKVVREGVAHVKGANGSV